jgi:hypothetical protein
MERLRQVIIHVWKKSVLSPMLLSTSNGVFRHTFQSFNAECQIRYHCGFGYVYGEVLAVCMFKEYNIKEEVAP